MKNYVFFSMVNRIDYQVSLGTIEKTIELCNEIIDNRSEDNLLWDGRLIVVKAENEEEAYKKAYETACSICHNYVTKHEEALHIMENFHKRSAERKTKIEALQRMNERLEKCNQRMNAFIEEEFGGDSSTERIIEQLRKAAGE